jgi:outer membrane protein assembly factor BamB/predicted phosphodiesterase
MKQLLLFTLLILTLQLHAQHKPFRFAFISDTHIGSPNAGADEDLRRTVSDINSMTGIEFVVITGDITELGTDEELRLAKQILDSLKIPYYIIPGNHDTGWSESGGLGFTKTFGSDKFYFQHNGIHFIGCASGPYVRMSDGHVPRDAMNWMKKTLDGIDKKQPVVFLNHYPLDNGLDNWYEVVDLLKQRNTVLALCGHGHNNRPVKAEDIPAVMGRSNLRAKAPEGGYNLVDVLPDSITFTVRTPVSKTEKKWTAVAFREQQYDATKNFPRPDFSMNDDPQNKRSVSAKWTYASDANVISTPVVTGDLVVFGNQNGLVEALKLGNGKRKWTFATQGPVFSSPAATKNRIVFGSADGFIYCLDDKGKLQWKLRAGASVLGSPVIEGNRVYIGSSDHYFRAIDINSGKEVWNFNELDGPVVSKPVISGNKIIFGAWDRNLYALDKSTGELLWKWNNGSAIRNYSPAACIPVIRDSVVFIVAPDRYFSAISIHTGQTLWRTNEATVRESIGISEDGRWVYGKTMQDTVVAFAASAEKQPAAWKMHAGYGYEHAPSMLIEKAGTVFFGTRNGVVYAIDPTMQRRVWTYKIDNSMVNTVNVIKGKQLIASTMDGKVVLLQMK